MYAIARAGYVLVEERRNELDLAAIRETLDEVDTLLQQHGYSGVIFDSRRLSGLGEDGREVWWAWLEREEHHERVAVVADSEMIRIRGNLTALSRKTAFRAFATMSEAVAWIRKS